MPLFILKTWATEVDGRCLVSGKGRARRSNDAVPSVFEGVMGYLWKIKSQCKQVRRRASNLDPSAVVCSHSSGNAMSQLCEETEATEDSVADVADGNCTC